MALFELNTPEFSMMLTVLPKSFQVTQVKIYIINLKRNVCILCISFYAAIEGISSMSSVGRSLDCRAGGRWFDPWGRTNTHGLKHNNEGTAFALQTDKRLCGLDEIVK